MSTQPTYDGCLPNFILPRTEACVRLHEMIETLNSPEFLKDEIVELEAEIAEHYKGIAEAEEDLQRKNVALAVAYAKPEYDRRRPHDDANVTIWETCCRAIEPTIRIQEMHSGAYRFWTEWELGASARSFITAQDAWRGTFAQLDRRKVVKS